MAVTALASLSRIQEDNFRKKVLALNINSDFLVQLAKKIQLKKIEKLQRYTTLLCHFGYRRVFNN